MKAGYIWFCVIIALNWSCADSLFDRVFGFLDTCCNVNRWRLHSKQYGLSVHKLLHFLQGCIDKDKLIDSQYTALSNLKNLSLCQDKYTQVRSKVPCKEKLIYWQSAALSNLKNLSLCQDKYTQVRLLVWKSLWTIRTLLCLTWRISACARTNTHR
jgi:hypothetical protein